MMSQKRSDVWLHYSQVDDQRAQCNICKKKLSYKGGGSSNLRKHLQSQHPTISLSNTVKENSIKEQPHISQKQMKIDDYSLQIKMSKQAQQRINECLLKMITKDLQPLSIVENKGFQEYTAALNSTYILPSRNTISKSLLPKAYENRLLDVKNSLETIENICITTDGWTSIANESYISLTGHFICHEWKQRSVFLSCFKTAKDHTANNLKDDICAALQEWNLDSKIACVLSDNAANIVAAIRKTGWTHLPCLAHTLHLVVMDALKSDGINEIIIKCKAVAEYFCRSTKACNKLKEIQKQMGKSNLKLINSMPTRWNSTLKMLERIVDNQEPLEATVAILHNPVQLFSLDEWETIRDIIGILQPFNEVTIEMSGETYTTISKVLVLTHGLQTFLLKKQSLQKNEKCCNMLEKLAANIKRRFHGSEFNEVYAISSFLDPRFKTKSFSDECALQICESKINMILENISTNHDIVLDVLLEKNLNEGSIWVEFDKNAIVSKNTTQKSFTEMEQYKNEAILERTKCPLEWWRAKENKYPCLAKIAKKYLCIVSTSVPSERIFSKAGQILTEKRNSLKSEIVEKLLFLHFND